MSDPLLASHRLRHVVGLDIRVQAREHIYLIGLGLAAIFGLVLRFVVTARFLEAWLPVIMMLGIGASSFLFAAALMLAERGENVAAAQRTSPLRLEEWLLSKSLTLGVFALLEALLWVVLTGSWEWIRPWPFAIGIAILALIHLLWGIALASPHRDITEVLMPSGIVFLCVAPLPVLHHLGLVDGLLWYLSPFQPAMLFLAAGSGRILSQGEWVYGTAYGALTVIGSAWWASRALRRSGQWGAVASRGGATDGGSSTESDAVKRLPTHRRSSLPRWLHLVLHDLKLMGRDRFLVFVAVLSLALGVALRFALPFLTDFATRQWDFDLVPYHPLILGYFLILLGVFPGFLSGFVLLEERDTRTLVALRVAPLSMPAFLTQRLLLPTVLCAVLTVLMGLMLNVFQLSLWQIVLIGVAAAPVAAWAALFLAVFADSKVQGVTYMKMLNAIGLLPAVAWFVPEPWQFLAGFFAPYWVTRAYWTLVAGEPGWLLWLAIGLVTGVATVGWFMGMFERRLRRAGC